MKLSLALICKHVWERVMDDFLYTRRHARWGRQLLLTRRGMCNARPADSRPAPSATCWGKKIWWAFSLPLSERSWECNSKTILAFLLLLKFRNNLERYIKKQQNKTKGSKYMKNSFPSLLLVYWKRKTSAI